MISNYDKYPRLSVSTDSSDCDCGWLPVVETLRKSKGGRTTCIECYPGVFEDEIEQALRAFLKPAEIFRTRACLKQTSVIDGLLARDLSEDPVFGRLSSLDLTDFFDMEALHDLKRRIGRATSAVVLGTGAYLAIESPYLLVYADLTRWEIQQRQRCGAVGNLGVDNKKASASEKY